ncbi:MAG: glucoamylase family protein [Acidobacteriaceae bacterium]
MKQNISNLGLEQLGTELAQRQSLLASSSQPQQFRDHALEVVGSSFALAQYVDEQAHKSDTLHGAAAGLRRLTENTRLLRSAAIEVRDALRAFRKLPMVRNTHGQESPRIVEVAQTFLVSTGFLGDIEGLTAFLAGFQREMPLRLRELWALPVAMKLVALEDVLTHANGALQSMAEDDATVDACIASLQAMQHAGWSSILEPLVAFGPALCSDPVGAYTLMDEDGRELYRNIIADLADSAEASEVEIANIALELAREAATHPSENARITARRSHIGYYLLDEGRWELEQRCRYRPGFLDRLRTLLRRHPDDFYVGGIQIVTFLIIAAILLPLVPLYNPLGRLAVGFLLLLLPASQGAVELLNHIVTALFRPYALPKIDFSAGIPAECKTLVAIPALLLNERQVRELVEELEVRSLANQDPNVHYALLSDLPDSVERPHGIDTNPLVLLAARLIDQLNLRYADKHASRFVMLHRKRTLNPRQGVWMGWERKRGKLMDLNRLLMGGLDHFPFKAGDTSVLQGIRYVLTLDSDTKLPRDSVRRMVGAMAHPLHCAIVDPQKKTVVAGYGLMQPRVGITVHSAARSRLAAVYSGQTGLDIYSRAISDMYQDLYGEGIFTGKGIYEVSILHQVLDQRFPQNSLLSHDLIEGAYARAGLLSDVEVIDDCPSHYSAQNKRKHRWVRGDWQICRWLLSRVPDESGRMVENPISTISRWKILDNLRRSLVEPGTFLLLIAGWFWLPGGARYWTLATLLVLFVPVLVQMAFSLVRAMTAPQAGTVRKALYDSTSQLLVTLLNFIFLAHQTQLMLDAIFRSLVRSFVTGEHLLEWETAAEAELGGSRQTPTEKTLRLVPLLCVALAALAFVLHPSGMAWILSILLLWSMVQPITWWLNRPFHHQKVRLSEQDIQFLRTIALRTWRYFAQHTTPRHHGLVPDNVQEQDHREAARISPTNIGLLLNARQAALVLGHLTLPEFLEQTLHDLSVIEGLPKWKGHLWNWYNTETLQPLPPLVASTVDSGNLLASLWVLRMGALELLHTPILPPALWEGLQDISRDPPGPTAFAASVMAALESSHEQWLSTLLAVPAPPATEATDAFAARVLALQRLVSGHLPWLLPRYAPLAQHTELLLQRPVESFTPESALTFTRDLLLALTDLPGNAPAHVLQLGGELLAVLGPAQQRLRQLLLQLREIASRAEALAQNMDFRPLLDPATHLLSIGHDAALDQRLHACYDLLASESRTAVFLAVAKGDIPQECWFRLGRKHTLVKGHPVLLSWTGTMFEYLMPSLWMRTLPETLLGQSLSVAVYAQRKYLAGKKIPWGISEAGHSQMDAEGNYQYHAFGLPTLALQPPPEGALVIAPYASILALEFDPANVLANLRRMQKMGWMGEFGFYESADYSSTAEHAPGTRYTLVRSWMAHHQGMSLLALANLLADRPFQRWFHAGPRVRATELLLHERPLHTVQVDQYQQKHEMVFMPQPGTTAPEK